MNFNLDEYLTGLHEGGELQSEGRFTVGLTALSKLRTFQFGQKEEYALRLVAAAVSLGASHIEITADRSAFEILMRSVELSSQAMVSVFENLFARETAPGLSDLAAAINGCLAYEPPPLVALTSWGQGVPIGVVIARDGEQVSIRPIPNLASANGVARGLKMVVKRKLAGTLMDNLFGSVTLPELTLLEKACELTRVPVIANRRSLHRDMRALPEQAWAGLHRQAAGRPFPLRVEPLGLQEKCKVWLEREAEHDCPYLVLLHGLDTPHGDLWVHNGLVLERTHANRKALVVIDCSALPLDLSRRKLMDGLEKARLEGMIEQDLDDLLAACATRGEVSPTARARMQTLVTEALPRAQGETARHLNLWLLASPVMGTLDQPASYWEKRRELADPELSAALLRTARQAWKKQKSTCAALSLLNPEGSLEERFLLRAFAREAAPPPANWHALWAVAGNQSLDFRNLLDDTSKQGPLWDLVRGDLCLGLRRWEDACKHYQHSDLPEGREGILLAELSRAMSHRLITWNEMGKVARHRLPNDAQDVSPKDTIVRFLRLLVPPLEDECRMELTRLRAARCGPSRHAGYLTLARVYMRRDQLPEAAQCLLLSRLDRLLEHPATFDQG